VNAPPVRSCGQLGGRPTQYFDVGIKESLDNLWRRVRASPVPRPRQLVFGSQTWFDDGHLRLAEVDTGQLTPAQAAVTEWCAWMRVQRGLTERSIAAYSYYAADLLDTVTAADE
jgi:hypothetical protein